tara:strand:- start:259 stop:450 length:192 start_codon:yes stop_codon:yes gene_type:complete
MQIKIGWAVMNVSLCHLCCCDREPVPTGIVALQSNKMGEHWNRVRVHLMDPFFCNVWGFAGPR